MRSSCRKAVPPCGRCGARRAEPDGLSARCSAAAWEIGTFCKFGTSGVGVVLTMDLYRGQYEAIAVPAKKALSAFDQLVLFATPETTSLIGSPGLELSCPQT
jgi:hypothetical protein